MTPSVIITSKDRCDDLYKSVTSCLEQTGLSNIVVIDDGSNDGSSNMVSTSFPNVTLVRHDESGGLIRRRNEAAQVATGDVLFSIDDDAEFSTKHVIQQTLADFDDPRVAVVAIPLLEPRYGERRLQFAPDDDGIWITDSFKGTAFAIRRDVFLDLGGFRADLVHQGEETDLAIRLLEKGYVVRLGRSDPIIHYESPKRDLSRTHFFGRRNDVLFSFRNVPARYFLVHAFGTTLNGLRVALGSRQKLAMFKGLLFGWIDGLRLLRTRDAVSPKTYRNYRNLRNLECIPMDEIFESQA